jgi:hypothetical protein
MTTSGTLLLWAQDSSAMGTSHAAWAGIDVFAAFAVGIVALEIRHPPCEWCRSADRGHKRRRQARLTQRLA